MNEYLVSREAYLASKEREASNERRATTPTRNEIRATRYEIRGTRYEERDTRNEPRDTNNEPRKRFNENCFGQVESFLRARQRQDQSHADCNAALSFVAAPGLGHPALLRQGGYESGTDR